MKKWSLRVQITAAVGMIMVIACVVLTVNSIYSASNHYLEYIRAEGLIESEQPQTYDEAYVEADKVELSDVIHNFSVQGLAVMLITVAASLVFTWWAAGRLVRPLERLTEMIRTIHDGNLGQAADIPNGTREVYQLSESFNALLERLDRSFQIQKNFAANAAHELKTPITGMTASLQVLKMDEKPEAEDYEEFVQDIDNCLGRLGQTVDSLLAMTGKSVREARPVALKAAAEKAVSDLLQKALQHHISFTIEGEEIAVSGSPVLFQRAIFNIIDNAVKYNKEDGKVCVRIYRAEKSACVEVRDTGCGIPKEKLDEIFEPFYRGDVSRSQEIEGSGLGLAIVKAVMEQYDGAIKTKSMPGKGTVITLEFKA